MLGHGCAPTFLLVNGVVLISKFFLKLRFCFIIVVPFTGSVNKHQCRFVRNYDTGSEGLRKMPEFLYSEFICAKPLLGYRIVTYVDII